MTQAELGLLLGAIPQTTISRWESGSVDLTMEQVFDLEVALDLPHGALATAAGYATTTVDVKAITSLMRSDPAVLPELRQDAIRSYKSYVEISRRFMPRTS